MMLIMSLLAQKPIRNPVLPDLLGGGNNPDFNQGTTVFGNLIGALIGGLLFFSFIIALFYLLTGALKWITSSGDKVKLEEARNKITHALMGLIIVFAIWAIMTVVADFFGIGFPEIPFPTLDSVLNNSPSSTDIRFPDAPHIPY